ncbi:MAG: glycine/betaine/sarcosine/D-proline family reductase selenoprotein B [Chloroflexi bacterium]|nr:glycine/betaine/sarcosine/D-proline family reductase selenoprotein B [Chloroflexota bacterium]
MANKVRVVHYINQFFGGIGGEDKSDIPVQVHHGPVGPGRALQMALGDRAEVVATIICGDDFIAENEDEAGESIGKALDDLKPDLVLAGPAFDSGRYGLGCALVCRISQSKNIPAVSGMHPDNAAVITHRRDLLAVPTGLDATEMKDILSRMAELGLKLAAGGKLGPAGEDGYIPRGKRELVFKKETGSKRALDMLLARVKGETWESEIAVQRYATVTPAAPVEDLSSVKLGIVVSTGIVPRGNPDAVPSARSLHAGRYSFEGLEELDLEHWESVHGGFNTRILNTVNPNYALPLPALRKLVEDGVIGELYPFFYSTVGNQTAIGPAQEIGKRVAEDFKAAGVSAAIQVAG